MAPIPITIITGFLGSGKTTILLNLIPQLPPSYRLALLKNEFGDVAVDSQLASTASISGVRELLNGCICCNLVGQLSDALVQLRAAVRPDRIVIETSGSAFPATLAMEVNRLARELPGESFVLDGVISVIDVENWQGYEDTSYTAKLQAQYTDLIIFNKWEACDEMRLEICLDRLGDLELQTAWVKSDHGRVEKDLLLGTDGALLSKELERSGAKTMNGFAKNGEGRAHAHDHAHDHQSEVEVLSVSLAAPSPAATAKLSAMEDLLLAAPKDEVYRIKGIVRGSTANPPTSSSGERAPAPDATTAAGDADGITQVQNYILNWAFGRWTFTPSSLPPSTTSSSSTPGSGGDEVVRLTLILARHESAKWKKKLENGGLVEVEGEPSSATLTVTRIS